MKNTKIEIEAEKITTKLIEICNKNKQNNKSIIELFEMLLSPDMKDKNIEVLSLIPRKLAEKGYDIIETSPLRIKEY